MRVSSSPLLLLLPNTLALGLAGCPPAEDGNAPKESVVVTGTDFEPGCILVDGGGGYALLEDALSLAGDGTVVTLCEGEWEAELKVEAAVIIEGAGPELTRVVGPLGATPLTFKAGGGVRNLTVSSSYNGVEIDGGADVVIDGVVFEDMPNRAVDASDTTNLQVTNSTFNKPGAGGVRVKRGSGTVSNSVFNAPGAAAIIGEEATLIVSGNQFVDVEQTARNDGYALDVTDSDLTASGNTYTNCEEGGLKASGGSLSLSGESITDTPVGIFAEESTFEALDLTIANAKTIGMYVSTGSGLITLQNVNVSIAAGESCTKGYASARVDECGGVALLGLDGIVVDGLTVTGYEDFGAQIYSTQADAEVNVPVTLSNISLIDNGRIGMTLAYTTGTLANINVTGLREPEIDEEYICFDDGGLVYIGRSTGVLVTGGEMDISGGAFLDNSGWDTFVYDAVLNIDSVSFSGSTCAGLMNAVGAASVTNSTFTRATLVNVYDIQGVTELIGNHFVDNQDSVEVSWYENVNGDHITRVETDYAAVTDVIAGASQTLIVRENVFERGGASILADSVASVELYGNSWTDYRSTILYSYSVGQIDFSSSTLDNVAGPLLYSFDSSVSVSEMEVGELVPVELPQRTYLDGVLVAESTSHAVGGGFTFYQFTEGSAYRLELSDVSIDTLTGYALQFADGSIEIDNFSVVDSEGDDVYGGIYGYSSYGPVDVDIEGAQLGNVGGYGVYAASYSGDGGTVVLRDVELGDVAYYGVYLYGATYVEMENVSVQSAGYYGIFSSTYEEGATLSMLDSVVEGAGTLSSGYAAVYLSGGELFLEGNALSGGSSDGLSMYNATVDVQSNSSNAHVGYGMVCSSLTYTACASNDLSANGLGEMSGCDAACSAAP